jgi:NarL family two-component system response regulator LiaR
MRALLKYGTPRCSFTAPAVRPDIKYFDSAGNIIIETFRFLKEHPAGPQSARFRRRLSGGGKIRYDLFMTSIVLVDDHPMIRRGFAAYLAGTGRFTVRGEAASLGEARTLFRSLAVPPGLVLLDIELGDENGLELIDFLKKHYGGQKPAVLVYSIFEAPFRVQAAVNRGAAGYISKSAGEAEIGAALDAVLRGERYVEKKLAEKTREKGDVYNLLTRREREILSLVQKNYNNRRISGRLALEIRTVENYLTRIYAKTGARSRGDLARL